MEILSGVGPETHELRKNVLNWQNIEAEQDATAQHLIAKDSDESVVGVLSCHVGNLPLKPEIRAAHFYAVAVRDDKQREGIGAQLIYALERYAISNDCEVIWAKARESALGFYMRLGFSVNTEPIHDPNTGLTNYMVYRQVTTPTLGY